MDPKFVFDADQSRALRAVIGAAHPYKAVLPNRWTKSTTPSSDTPIYPKPSIGTMDAAGLGIAGLGAGDLVESPRPAVGPPRFNGPADPPAEASPHIYELCLNEIQIVEYPGVYKGFNGIEHNIQRAMRIPYLYYKDTEKGSALLVKDYVTVLYEGGAGH